MTEVIKVEDCGENIGDYDVPIYKAILIPENATNGDMIKAMFPNVSNSKLELVDVLKNARSWWNSPYKAESEE